MQKEELKKKLEKAKSSWQYIWDLIDKLLKEGVDYYVKELLFRYQVELDSNFRKIDEIENKLSDKEIVLTKEEYYSVDQLLSWITTDHAAKALFIDNLLRNE